MMMMMMMIFGVREMEICCRKTFLLLLLPQFQVLLQIHLLSTFSCADLSGFSSVGFPFIVA